MGPFKFEVRYDIDTLILNTQGVYEGNDLYYGFWYKDD